INATSTNWTLVGPAGTIVANRALNGSDSNDFGSSPLLRLTPGNYTLTVDGTGDTAATPYSFRLLDIATATAYTPGNLLTGTLIPGTQTQLFKFNATIGQMFFFDVQTNLSGGGVF